MSDTVPQKPRLPRAPLVFAGGLLLAAGAATILDGAAFALAQAFQGRVDLSQAPVELAPQAPLNERERRAAARAWAYFEHNTQPDTGLVDAVAGFPSATLWDQGSYLLALVSAQRLGLIDAAEFDGRVALFVDTLGRLPLFEGQLPNKVYDTQSLAMVDYANAMVAEGIGWSALDLARLLMGLRVVEKHFPHHGAQIRAVLAGWNLPAMAAEGELIGATKEAGGVTELLQEGRVGYEQYGARAAALWGLDVIRAMSAERVVDWREVSGIEVPGDLRRAVSFGAITPTLSEPYLLLALELGFDAESHMLAHRLYEAQEARFEETGHLTAVSEDHLNRAPHFAYSSVTANGRPWAVVTEAGTFHDDLRTLSTKAAFGWDALYGTAYTAELKEAVLPLGTREGFPAGIYEADGSINDVYTLNTNAVILEALHYQVYGPLWSVR
ncbi:MAG: DUF3131 domain-containing protein [Pseudomonadota bacterium]